METSQMSDRLEKHVLIGVLKALDEQPPPLRKFSWLTELGVWVVVAGLSFGLFRTFGSASWFQTLLPIATFGFGMLFMSVYFRTQRQGQWPIIGKYVDRSRVEARLRELGA